MRRNRAFFLGLGGSVSAVAISLLVSSCLSDPRAEDADVPTPVCDASNYKTLLSSAPTSGESTLKTFVEASLELKAATDELELQLRDACNALAAELTLPQGQDVRAACKQLADRVDGINKPPMPPAVAPNAYPAQVRFATSCRPEVGALEACLATCGAKDCSPGKCEPNARMQKCAGTCKGKCITTGASVACKGSCVGDIPLEGGPEAALPCTGECTGACSAGAWAGKCEGACAASFLGACAGTCTGKCDGEPINDGAVSDGGPPGLANPPENAPGNCTGTCSGQCSSGADGFCRGWQCYSLSNPQVPAPFKGSCPSSLGACRPGPAGGNCRSAEGSGTTTVCKGTCEVPVEGTCEGVCQGECQGSASEVTCTAPPSCGQNAECTNACEALVALRTKCDESLFEAYALRDPVLLAAWGKLGAQFSKPVQRIAQLRAATGFIGQRTYGNFVAIGLKGGFIRSCVEFGNQNISTANDKVLLLSTVNPTARR